MATQADLMESLIFVILGLVLGGSAAFMTYFSLARRSGEPRCGQCGYLTKAATSFTCPKCGSDLREVGIVRRQTHGPFVVATCAGLAVAGAVTVVGGWLSL